MNLAYSLNDAWDAGEMRLPYVVIAELGIHYRRLEAITIMECIIVVGATNVPDPLPSYIRVINV